MYVNITILIKVGQQRRVHVVARTEWELLKKRPAEKNETHIHGKFESSGTLSTVFYREKKK